MDCPNLKHCPFFNDHLSGMPAVSGYLKNQFCKASYKACARYLIFEALGSEYVPGDLFPNEPQRAQEIISKTMYYRKK